MTILGLPRPSGLALGASTALVLALTTLGGTASPASPASPAAAPDGVVTRVDAAEPAARAKVVKVTPARPMKGERTKFTGTQRGKARPALERKKGGTWMTVARGKVSKKGTYKVKARVPKKGTYRIHAGAFTSKPVRVRTVGQSSPLSAEAPLVVGLRRTVTATVLPIRKGREVTLERRTGSKWKAVAKRTTDAAGTARLPVTGSTPGTASYRVVASSFHKSRPHTSPATIIRTAPVTELLSPGGVVGEESYTPSISADGRWVVFSSETQLLPADIDDDNDIYLSDRATGVLTLLVPTANSHTNSAVISGNGRYVLFQSLAFNLADEADSDYDVFVLDRNTGVVELISKTAADDPGNGGSFAFDISDDGRFVAFTSTADDLVVQPPPDSLRHAYVHDRTTGTTRGLDRIGLGWSDDNIYGLALSGDGTAVAFQSTDPDLDPGDVDVIAIHRWTIASNGVLSGRTNLTPDFPARIPSLDRTGDLLAFTSPEAIVPDDLDAVDDAYLRMPDGSYALASPAGVGDVQAGDISADGRFLAMYVDAPQPGDTNGDDTDIGVWDRITDTHRLVTRGGPGYSGEPQLSADGSTVAFASVASGLVSPPATGDYNVFVAALR